MNLRPTVQQPGGSLGEDVSSSLLFRLVDVAARTLEAASPPEGHLARRYVPLLRGMRDLILSGNTQAQNVNGNVSTVMTDASNLPSWQMQNHLGENLWEMWQQAGLGPMVCPDFVDEMYEG